MRNSKKTGSFVHAFTEEKLNEFKALPLKARLQWLEEANKFINKAIGFEKRALFDERFEIHIKKKNLHVN